MASLSRRLLLALCVLVAGSVAAADDHAEVEAHLMRLPHGAIRLGRTRTDTPVEVVVGLGWRNAVELQRLVHDVADPQSARYQQFVSPRAFERRFAPRMAQLGAINRFLRGARLHITGVSRSRLLVAAVGSARDVERALSTQLVDVLDGDRRRTVTDIRPVLPAELSARVVAVGAELGLRAPQDDVRGPLRLPLEPQEVAQLYGFDELYGRGVSGAADRASTIAIATAFGFDPADLQQFWSATGIARAADSVELIPVVGKAAEESPDADRIETTLDVQWATAMAPGSRVLVYAGTDALVSTFLKIYDRIVADNRAGVMTTSWGGCEADYSDSMLIALDAIFTRAAAQGITVIAAAGDHGGFECPGQSAPSVSLPAAHPYVLAVGGTSLQLAGTQVGEVVWSGSGGGVSQRYPPSPWQMTAHTGRALNDVALNADPTTGYLMYYAGHWGVFGGTSVGAPIWAALLSLANQARADTGRPAVGLAAPLFCEAALATDLAGAEPFTDIVDGNNGAFAAAPGFDLPSGWGVPRAAALVRALSEWTPPAGARGGVAEIVHLSPAAPGVDGSARLRFERRCLSMAIDLQARQLPPGFYTIDVDGVPAASFSPDARGCMMSTLSGIDIRGHVVSIRADGGAILFSSDAASPPSGTPTPAPSVDVHAPLMSTGLMANAQGSVDYHRTGSRHELTVRVTGLPDGRYDVRLGAEVIGTVLPNGGSAVAYFDSEGMSGTPLGALPRCQPLVIVRAGSMYLRTAGDALSPGECS